MQGQGQGSSLQGPGQGLHFFSLQGLATTSLSTAYKYINQSINQFIRQV